MNIACGTDIIEINRIEKAISNVGARFLNRVFTRKEIEYCESKNKMKFQHYAARFSAKEAVFKAVSSFIENKYDLRWKDIEVSNDEKGKPIIKLLNCNIKEIKNIDISLSHCKDYAVAMVVVIF